MSIKLPAPKYTGNTSVEEALKNRRSIRDYRDIPLSKPDLSQLLWSAQGTTHKNFFRTTPSAGALYPIEVYAAIGNVSDVKSGIYKYNPKKHELELVVYGDKRKSISRAALSQDFIQQAAVVIVLSAVYERVTGKYHEKGITYTHMEMGHAAQNILLQSYSLKLGSVVIGAFYANELNRLMNMKKEERPLYIIPVGKIDKR